ncbi:MAG: hypothetical protein FWF59_05860 [Turicibacter sp.]|nr:hypothetical protein [Turicibacter sp.]
MKNLFLIAAAISFLTACGHSRPEPSPDSSGQRGNDVHSSEENGHLASNKENKKADANKESENAKAPAKSEVPEMKPIPHEEVAVKHEITYPVFPDKAVEAPEKASKAAPKGEAPSNDPLNQLVAVYVDELDSTYNTPTSNIKSGFSIIHKDERYASILFTGKLDRAEYAQDFISTLNIDLKSGCKTQLNQIVLIDGDFIDIVYGLLEDKIVGLGGDMKKLYPHGIEDLIYAADVSIDSPVHSYFNNSHITLVFSVPHKLGDYVTVTVPNKIQAVFD